MGGAPPGRQLPIVLRPAAGENVHGFLRRLAEANGHLSMSVFAPAIGLPAGFGSMSAGPAWERLAQTAALTEADVLAMRWTAAASLGGSKPVVAGVETTKGFVLSRQTRVCVSCLRENRVRRDFWSFSAVVACPRHGSLLATHCRCGRTIPPGNTGRTRECTCGVPWSDLVEAQAPEAAVRVARNLAARVGAVSGYSCENDHASPFDALRAHDYMAVVYTLGVAAVTPASEDRPLRQAKGTYRAGTAGGVDSLGAVLASHEAAVRIIDGWPEEYAALLGRIEGRNARTDASTIAGAFATSIGKLLVAPIRGADGLPLRLLCEAVDRYWDLRGGGVRRRRRRNLSVTDAIARRLHGRFNGTSLAHAVGQRHGTAFLGRILRRSLERLSEEERRLDDRALARLVRLRSIALYRDAVASLSADAAREALEGTSPSSSLTSWVHPRLLQADPSLYGLRRKGQPAYTKDAVAAVLARLRAVARRTDQAGDLVPLASVALRRKVLRWDKRPDVLLDVVDGRLPVYTMVEEPRLNDLLVSPDEFRRASHARDPRSKAPDGFLDHRRLNTVLEGRFGPAGRLTLDEFRRLHRGGLVPTRSVRREFPSGRPKATRVYSAKRVVDFLQRRRRPEGLPLAEAEAFGRIEDIGPLLAALHDAPMTTSRMADELGAGGVRTEGGARWEHAAIARALRQAGAGRAVPGLLTGPAFSDRLAAVGGTMGGAAAKPATPRRAYPSDLSDEEWALLAPHLTLQSEASSARRHPLREVFNGLRYLTHNRVGWVALPDGLPPWYTVLCQARRWVKAGCFEAAARALHAAQAPNPATVGAREGCFGSDLPPRGDTASERSSRPHGPTSLVGLRQGVGKLDRLLAARMAMSPSEPTEVLFHATGGRPRPRARPVRQATLHALGCSMTNLDRHDLARGSKHIEPADAPAGNPSGVAQAWTT